MDNSNSSFEIKNPNYVFKYGINSFVQQYYCDLYQLAIDKSACETKNKLHHNDNKVHRDNKDDKKISNKTSNNSDKLDSKLFPKGPNKSVESNQPLESDTNNTDDIFQKTVAFPCNNSTYTPCEHVIYTYSSHSNTDKDNNNDTGNDTDIDTPTTIYIQQCSRPAEPFPAMAASDYKTKVLNELEKIQTIYKVPNRSGTMLNNGEHTNENIHKNLDFQNNVGVNGPNLCKVHSDRVIVQVNADTVQANATVPHITDRSPSIHNKFIKPIKYILYKDIIAGLKHRVAKNILQEEDHIPTYIKLLYSRNNSFNFTCRITGTDTLQYLVERRIFDVDERDNMLDMIYNDNKILISIDYKPLYNTLKKEFVLKTDVKTAIAKRTGHFEQLRNPYSTKGGNSLRTYDMKIIAKMVKIIMKNSNVNNQITGSSFIDLRLVYGGEYERYLYKKGRLQKILIGPFIWVYDTLVKFLKNFPTISKQEHNHNNKPLPPLSKYSPGAIEKMKNFFKQRETFKMTKAIEWESGLLPYELLSDAILYHYKIQYDFDTESAIDILFKEYPAGVYLELENNHNRKYTKYLNKGSISL